MAMSMSSTMSKDIGASSTANAMSMSSTGSASIANLPPSDPRCNNDTCLAFEVASATSQAQFSWADQFFYGHYMAYYYYIFIFLFGLVHWSRKLKSGHIVYPEVKTTITQKMLAFGRSFTYRRIGIGMSLGTAAFIGLAVLFAPLWCSSKGLNTDCVLDLETQCWL
jgi:hypothetical protein